MDEYQGLVQRLQSIQPFSVEQVSPEGVPMPWAVMNPQQFISELIINNHTIQNQINTVAAQIATWGRITAQCQRLCSIHERNYRYWRSKVELKCLQNGVPEVSKTTQSAIESYYRTLPEYAEFQAAIERAEEAKNAAQAIFEAFKAKSHQLSRDVRIGSDGSVTRFSP